MPSSLIFYLDWKWVEIGYQLTEDALPCCDTSNQNHQHHPGHQCGNRGDYAAAAHLAHVLPSTFSLTLHASRVRYVVTALGRAPACRSIEASRVFLPSLTLLTGNAIAVDATRSSDLSLANSGPKAALATNGLGIGGQPASSPHCNNKEPEPK